MRTLQDKLFTIEGRRQINKIICPRCIAYTRLDRKTGYHCELLGTNKGKNGFCHFPFTSRLPCKVEQMKKCPILTLTDPDKDNRIFTSKDAAIMIMTNPKLQQEARELAGKLEALLKDGK